MICPRCNERHAEPKNNFGGNFNPTEEEFQATLQSDKEELCRDCREILEARRAEIRVFSIG